MACMVVVAWWRAAARSCTNVGCGHAQQLLRVQLAVVVFGGLRGAELRPQQRQRPRGTGQRSSVVLWRRLVARRRGRALLIVFRKILLRPSSLGFLLIPPAAGRVI